MSTESSTLSPEQRRRGAKAAFIGSFLEYYDFVLYATAAATVFSTVFFPDSSPALATLQSVATFAVAYVIRPFGAALLGSLGDRIGRQRILIASLMIMGVATLAIGLIPGYAAIGWAAPALLVAFRMLQGLGASAEYSGATLVAVEFAKANRRGLMGSLVPAGAGLGGMVSSVALLAMSSALTPEQFLAWGWRVPFIASTVLLAYGLWLRLRLQETPAFHGAKQAGRVSARPVRDVLRSRPRAVLAATLLYLAAGSASIFFVVFMPSFATNQAGLSTNAVFIGLIIAQFFGAVFAPLFGWLSDRMDRRRVVLACFVLYAALAFPVFWLVQPESAAGYWLAMFLGGGLVYSIVIGPLGALTVAMVPPVMRFSGIGISREVGLMLGSALMPFVAIPLAFRSTDTWPLSVLLISISLVGLVGLALVRLHSAGTDVPTTPADDKVDELA